MISVNSLCQYLNELANHSEKKVESLESFFVEGEFSTPVENLIKFIGANNPIVFQQRKSHIENLKFLKNAFSESEFLELGVTRQFV